MTIIHIISFLVIAITAGYLLKVSLGDMLPFVWCGVILVLYMLAFGRNLNFIDYIMPALALGLTGLVWRTGKIKEFGTYIVGSVNSASFVVYAILIVVLPVCLSLKVVTWWDDINFWASDLKSLYYLGGFADKYANVSSAFGDYPPGVQLAKWYVVHTDKSAFREDLAFVGYYLFNLSFFMPLFKRIKGKQIWLSLPLAAVVWLFPGMADKYGYAGFCADLSMAFLFGSVLIAAFDEHEDNRLFDYLRITLYLSVLVICKSTGALWALFGLIIWVGVRLLNVTHVTKECVIKNLSVLLGPLFIGGSWMAFCLIRHRVTQTTSTMVTYLTTDTYNLSEYKDRFALAFAKAFFAEPLHVDHTWIDLSPALILVLMISVFVLLYKKNYLCGRAGRFVAFTLPVIGVVYYCIIFLAHITIFATETQYLESTAMIASIERYGVPFTLGGMIFIAWLWLNKEVSYTYVLIFCVCVLALTNVPAAWNGLYGYHATRDEDMAERTSFYDDASRVFISEVQETLPDGNVRVCRVEDRWQWVMDAYVAYEVSPTSVLTISYDLNQIDPGALVMAISQTHAGYVYFDEQTIENSDMKAWLDEAASDGEFSFGKVYFISYENGSAVFYPVN